MSEHDGAGPWEPAADERLLPLVEGYELTFALPFWDADGAVDDDAAPADSAPLEMMTIAVTTQLRTADGGTRYAAEVRAALIESMHALAEKLSFDSGMTLLGVSRAHTVTEAVELQQKDHPTCIADVKGSAQRADGVQLPPTAPGQTVSARDRQLARTGKHLRLVHAGPGAEVEEGESAPLPMAAGDELQPVSAADVDVRLDELGTAVGSSTPMRAPPAPTMRGSYRPWTAISRRAHSYELLDDDAWPGTRPAEI